MNQLKLLFYKISFSDKNPVFKHFTKKAPLDKIYGEPYRIEYKGKTFNNQMERGKGGIIFDIHGGGYLFGSHLDENHFCHYIHEKTGMSIVSCYYDLSRESKYPTQIKQIYQTIKTICNDPSVDTEHVFIMGHSAGGNAAAALTLLSNEKKTFHIDGEILVYPVTDMASDPKRRPKIKGNILPAGMMEVFNALYFKKTSDARSVFASPVLASDEQIKGLPPTYIITCAKDELRVDGIHYADRLKANGVEVQYSEVDEVHGFLENGMYNYYGKPQSESKSAKEDTDKIIRWIVAHAE